MVWPLKRFQDRQLKALGNTLGIGRSLDICVYVSESHPDNQMKQQKGSGHLRWKDKALRRQSEYTHNILFWKTYGMKQLPIGKTR